MVPRYRVAAERVYLPLAFWLTTNLFVALSKERIRGFCRNVRPRIAVRWVYLDMIPEDLPSPDVLKARNGDADAFARLTEVIRPQMLQLASRLMKRGDGGASHEDVVQDAIERAIRGVSSLRQTSDTSFRIWMMTIVRNSAFRVGESRSRTSSGPIRG